MQTASTKVQTAFRPIPQDRTDSDEGIHDEPNEETIAAIDEVRSGKTLERLDMDKFDEFVAGL